MKNLFSIIFSFCVTLLCCTLYGGESKQIVSPGQVESDLSEALEQLKVASPVLYERVRACPRDKQVRVMLRSLGVDVWKSMPPMPETVAVPKVYPAKLIYGNTMFYVRLDALNMAHLKQLKEDVAASARLKSSPQTAVIDLRNAVVTGETDVFPLFLQYLTEQAKAKNPFLRFCAVLTSHRTAPKAQLLAALLQKRGIAVNMGEPSAYPMHPLVAVVSCGQTIYVPKVTDPELFCLKVEVLPVEALPVYPYENFGKREGRTYDAAIRYAFDCLTAVRILSGAEP